MVVPPYEPVSPGRKLTRTEHDSAAHLDETLLLSSLKGLVGSGEHRLDPMLAAIADAARRLTGASGAALAMWKDGAMVCRARSGETAPALGAQLSADTGISGECLRTGKLQHCSDTENNPLVDVEVCRSLGLRSIAVLPIQGWRGINGILEVFSTAPVSFTDHHLALLDQLAALAERARATQPHGASPVLDGPPAEKSRTSGLLPASDRVRDVFLAFLGGRSRRLVLGGMGLAAILLVAFVIWLGWRGPGENGGKAHAAAPSAAVTVSARPPGAHLPDNDPVWKANPGGESLVLQVGKTSAGMPVKLASKVDVIQGKKTQGEQTLLAAEAANVALPHQEPGSDATTDASSTAAGPAEEAITVELSPIADEPSSPSALNGVLVAKASLPEFSAPVSQGVSGGRILHRVPPVYPPQAKTQRLEGRVVLSATVMEDGRVQDLKVLEGHPALAQSAVNAVKQWRFEPFALDGKVIKRETTVTIEFKLPSGR